MRLEDDPSGPPESSAESIDALEREARQRRRRTMLVLFVAIPLGVVVLGAGWWVLAQRAADRAVREAWDQASACLVGPPLDQATRPSLRMRAIQLAALHLERDQKGDQRWPSRCADAVAGLHEALRRYGRHQDGEEGLGRRSEEFAVALRKAEAMTDLSTAADGLFEAAAKAGLHAAPFTLPLPPPTPNGALDLDQLPAQARLSPLQYTLDRVSAPPHVDPELHLLLHDPKLAPAPLLCRFGAAGPDRCRSLTGPLVGKTGLRLGGTTAAGASPLVFAGRDGEDGIFRSEGGELVVAMRAAAAFVDKTGAVALASLPLDEHGSFELVEQAGAGAPLRRRTVEPDDFEPKATQIHRKELLWGKLLVQVLDESDDHNVPRLQVTDLPTQSDRMAFTDIAPVNWVNARIFGCRTPDSLVVRIGIEQGFLVFFEGSRWSTPLPVDDFPPAFGCDRGEAVFTSAWGGQQRCTTAGCTFTEGVAPSYEPFPQRDGALADLAGRILSVSLTDRRGGLRFRHTEGKNLAQLGADQLLFDDLIHGGRVGQDSTVLGMRLAGRGRFAVLLLSTPAGVYALRFDDQGKPSPANIGP